MLTRFSIDMDGSMAPDEAGQWVRYEDVVKLREPAQQGPVPRRVAECLMVLRPTVKGKFPQEQALDELVGHLTSPQAQQPAPAQEPFDFDAAFDAVNWDEWRHKPVRELVRELHRVTTPVRDPAPPADVQMLTPDEIDAALHVALPSLSYDSEDAFITGVRVGEKLVRQKAGLP